MRQPAGTYHDESACAECTRWRQSLGDCAARGEEATGRPAETQAPPETPSEFDQALDQAMFAGEFGTGFGYEAAIPNIIGDFFGGSSQQVTITETVPVNIFVAGFLAGGSPGGSGSANAALVFERGGGTPNDFTSTGLGQDVSGDGFADTFAVSEPVPPNDSPVSPGAGFSFDGGTAVFTNSTAVTSPQNGVFQDGNTWFASYSFTRRLVVNVPGGGGAVVRRIKLAENNSPLPRDRIYWNYNYFNNARGGFGDINRYVFGFEKTFWGGGMSCDVRIPFASTLAADQLADAIGSRNTQLGNATLIWKAMLWQTARTDYSGGLGVSLPTANDTRLFFSDGRQLLQIDNGAVHLLPFLAMLHTPNDQLFVQSFLQFDIDPNGNPIYGDATGRSLQRLGTLHDATFLFVDVTMGYWLYRNPSAGVIKAVSPVLEVHYSSTLQDTDALTGSGLTVTSLARRFDIVNMTLGTHFFLGQNLTVTPAIAVPLTSGDNKQFDYEAVVLANWFF